MGLAGRLGKRSARHTTVHRARLCEEQHGDHEQNAYSALFCPRIALSEDHVNIIGTTPVQVKGTRIALSVLCQAELGPIS